jgi:chemotaxis signal transduction protein
VTAGTAGAVIDGLECRIGQGRMIVPMTAVAEVGRYRVGGRLPTAARHVAGIGAWEGRLVVSLSLVAPTAAIDREATGVLLETRRQTPMRWALEIIAPVGIVRVAEITPNVQQSSRRPAWLQTATTSDRRTMLWIDVEDMIAAAGAR